MQVIANIQGADEIRRKLAKLPERLGRNAARRALRKGANVIRNAARENAKRLDDPNSPEQIWRNVAVYGGGARREKKAGGVILRVGIRGGARNMEKYGEFRGKGKGNPGGDTWYWRLVEFGTSRTAAKPFMRPAMNNNASKAAQVVFEGMEYEFNKEAAKLARG